MNKEKAIVLTHGWLDGDSAKTAHGLIRGSERFEILAIIDYKFPGQDAGFILDGKEVGIPIFESVAAFGQAHPGTAEYCLIGVAMAGGTLPDSFRGQLQTALEHGISLISGLHAYLQDDEAFVRLARENNCRLIDIRRPRPAQELQFWTGKIMDLQTPRLAILGTDCAIGKRTTTRFLLDACQEADIKAEMIYTGQTGWMQSGKYGFILDSTLNDFVSGEIERAILDCAQDAQPDVILIEGQSALRNPTGPCGSEIICSGKVHGVILQHAPGRAYYKGTEALQCSVPDPATEIELMAMYGAPVLALTLSEEEMEEKEMERYQRELESRLGIPVIRPLKEGVERLVPMVQKLIDTSRSPA